MITLHLNRNQKKIKKNKLKNNSYEKRIKNTLVAHNKYDTFALEQKPKKKI